MMALRFFFRKFLREKTSSLIILLGLVLGLTTAFMISLYVINEMTYDRYPANAKRIYRVLVQNTDHHFTQAQTSYLFGPAAKQEIPEIEDYCRIFTLAGSAVKSGRNWIKENSIAATDSGVFNLFSIHLISGTMKGRYDPSSIWLSQSFAQKYFGPSDPVGQILTVNNKNQELLFTVKGVYQDFPFNATFRPDAIIPMEVGHQQLKKYLVVIGNGPSPLDNFTDQWDQTLYTTYLLLKKTADPEVTERKVQNLVKSHLSKDQHFKYSLQKLADVYLHSDGIFGSNEKTGSITNVLIFLLVSILVLLASGMNYVLLSTAKAITRVKEMGIRRTAGATKRNMASLFISEALLTNLMALPLAIMLSELLLPFENRLLDTKLSIHYTSNPLYLAVILFTPLLLGTLAGLYVSHQAYRFSTIDIMKNPFIKASGLTLKKTLICFQLIVFIALISSVIIIRMQTGILLKTDLGYDTKNVLIVPFDDEKFRPDYEAFKNEIAAIPGVEKVSGALVTPPSDNVFSMQFDYPDVPDKKIVIHMMVSDYGFIETMGMKLLSGRTFSRDYPSDKDAVVITESAAREMNLKEPVGTKLPIGTVIGVVSDFQLHSLRQPRNPAYISLDPGQIKEIIIKAAPGAMPRVIEPLRRKMTTLTGSDDFRYSLYGDKLAALYQTELRLRNIISIFTGIALLLACLGLFGLSYFIAEQRTKEIGIRKVNGASVANLLFMLSKDVSKWVLISALIATGPVWYFLNHWLQHYAYRMHITFWIFVLSTLMALFIALATTLWHGIRTTTRNPVDSLRYE